MSDGTFALVEILFVAAVALGFGIWQLVSVTRLIRQDREKARQAERQARDEQAR